MQKNIAKNPIEAEMTIMEEGSPNPLVSPVKTVGMPSDNPGSWPTAMAAFNSRAEDHMSKLEQDPGIITKTIPLPRRSTRLQAQLTHYNLVDNYNEPTLKPVVLQNDGTPDCIPSSSISVHRATQQQKSDLPGQEDKGKIDKEISYNGTRSERVLLRMDHTDDNRVEHSDTQVVQNRTEGRVSNSDSRQEWRMTQQLDKSIWPFTEKTQEEGMTDIWTETDSRNDHDTDEMGREYESEDINPRQKNFVTMHGDFGAKNKILPGTNSDLSVSDKICTGMDLNFESPSDRHMLDQLSRRKTPPKFRHEQLSQSVRDVAPSCAGRVDLHPGMLPSTIPTRTSSSVVQASYTQPVTPSMVVTKSHLPIPSPLRLCPPSSQNIWFGPASQPAILSSVTQPSSIMPERNSEASTNIMNIQLKAMLRELLIDEFRSPQLTSVFTENNDKPQNSQSTAATTKMTEPFKFDGNSTPAVVSQFANVSDNSELKILLKQMVTDELNSVRVATQPVQQLTTQCQRLYKINMLQSQNL